MKEIKGGNMVQKFKFYAWKGNAEQVAVSISFAVTSVYLLHIRTGMTINFSFLSIFSCPCILCGCCAAPIHYPSFMLPGSAQELQQHQTADSACKVLVLFIYWDAFFCFSIRSTSFNQPKKAEDTRCFLVLVANYQRTWQTCNFWGYQERFKELNKQRLRTHGILKK